MATKKLFDSETNQAMAELIKEKNLTLLSDRGAFTRAYVNQDKTEVYLQSICPAKEINALGWFPDSDLFPKMEMLETHIYKMEYFAPVKGLKNSLDADQYEIYKQLREVGSDNNTQDYHNPHNNYKKLFARFEQLENEDLKEVMIEALDGCSNFGSDVCFEISPRNVAVKNGKLILLDVFFSAFALKKIRK